MEGSRIDLKSFLSLDKPNQDSQSARKQISSWFWGDNFEPKSPNLHDPYTQYHSNATLHSFKTCYLRLEHSHSTIEGVKYEKWSREKSSLGSLNSRAS